MIKKLNLSFIFLIIVVIGFILYYREGILPVDKKDNSTKVFVIARGEALNQIAKDLSSQGLIRSRIVFYLVARSMGIEKKIQAGDFRLSPSQNIYQIVESLTHGTLDAWITLIEGLRKEEIAQIISKDFDVPESEFVKSATEGYLFPDTYLIPKDATAGSIINILSNNFAQKFSEDLKKAAAKNGLSEKEVIILASLVEREGKVEEDRKIIASIFLKRYLEDWPIQVDASVQYALGYQANDKTWWKKYLTVEDLKINSPYNTYVDKGLPPGPICNPGLSSISAVVYADKNTPYWYYLSDTKGQMHYAVTLEEHNQNIRRYLK